MAYVPPHKRQSEDVRSASPIPETLQPQFQRNMNLRASTSHKNKCGKIVYEDHAISKWFAGGLDDDGQFPPNIHLEPTSLKHVERESGEKPLVLVDSVITEEAAVPSSTSANPAASPSFLLLHRQKSRQPPIIFSGDGKLGSRKEMDEQSSEKVKPTLIAGLGKFLFHGYFMLRCSTKLPEVGIEFLNFPPTEVNSMIYSMNSLTFASATSNVHIVDIIYCRNPSIRLQGVNKIQVEEAILRQLNRSMYTNIPSSYMENIIDGVVPTIGVDFEEEKDVYTVKVELNQVCHMVIDVSCPDKNLDLRLKLSSRRILTALTSRMVCGSNKGTPSSVKGGNARVVCSVVSALS
ncbi:hypothetical protein SADUNF_Sadunf19G0036700 [Salix dunnii]|uniref:DUF7903 domain-containing protein n=1 Tax=Salix dunnii TaxID=1413687 RepID=A0A835J3P4_9ROSI|nr:hypothetical protein SADUNF_Sadunf19G0036700 [Salix dunnii]